MLYLLELHLKSWFCRVLRYQYNSSPAIDDSKKYFNYSILLTELDDGVNKKQNLPYSKMMTKENLDDKETNFYPFKEESICNIY